MRITTGLMAIGIAWSVGAIATAQPPGGPGGGLSKSADVSDLQSRMMAFDANKDGKLTRVELTDDRLVRLFGRADADKDGTVTKAELDALGEKEHIEDRGGPGGGPGFGPPGGGPGFGGPGGPPSRPGEVLSPILQQRLELSDEQRSQVEKLQAEVDARLEKILNDEQKSTLQAARRRGPGGGPPGGGRRPGGPGGGPPGGGPGPR